MYALIALYSLLFFWKFWKNPYLNHTSEIGTTFFPHWIWTGRKLRSGSLPFKDNLYYKYPACIPFLSTFYPPHWISAFIGSFLPLNNAFRLHTYLILSHYIFGSCLAYHLFSRWCSPEVALFGSITLFYSAYSVKLQQPCISYTMAWIPGIFLPGWLGVLSMTMALCGGYYPILIYLLPFVLVVHTKTVLLGALFALPQLIPFLIYFKQSVRWGEKVPVETGRLSLIALGRLFLPIRSRTHVSGVMFMESEMYMSLLPFLFIWFSSSRFWYVLAFGVAVSVGWLRSWQRIPARTLYIVTLSITILATDGLGKLGLPALSVQMICLLQAVLLLFNRDIYPCFPFTQWWTKPEDKNQDYTGYLSEEKLHEYRGAFSLKY